MNSLKEEFEAVVKKYIEVFCNKHKLIFDFWVCDLVGTVGQFGDFYFDMETIRLDIDNDVPKAALMKWYQVNMESFDKQQLNISYYMYLKDKNKIENAK